MKTTFVIDDTVMRRLKERASREGRTLSGLVEAALRSFLASEVTESERHLPDRPTASLGHARVDVADRDALYELMERT